jgi:hypothetical protein
MAADSVGKLSAKVVADPTGFKLGLDAAAKHAQSWASRITGMLRFALPAIGVAGAAHAFASTISALENVGDAAASAGVSVEDFMKATGRMKSEDVNAATTALTKMGKSMAELTGGDKDKEKSFKAAGLDPDAFRTMDIATALQTVAKAFTDAEDPVNGLRIAYAAFGKSAAEVIPVLDKMAKGDGTIGGKFAGMTAADIKRAEEADEALTQLGNKFKNVRNQLVLDLSDVPNAVSDFFSSGSGEKFRQRVRARLEDVDRDAKKMADRNAALKKQQEEEERIKKRTDALKSIAEVSRGFAADESIVKMSPSEAKAFEERQKMMEKFGGKLPRDIANRLDTLDQEAATVKTNDFVRSLKDANRELLTQVDTFGASEASTQRYVMRLKMLKAGIDEMHPRFKEANRELEKNVALTEQQAANKELLGLQQEAEPFLASQRSVAQQILDANNSLKKMVAQEVITPEERIRALGEQFRPQIKAALEPFKVTAPGTRFGTGEDFSFRARFEQSQLIDRKSIQEQIKMALDVIARQEQENGRALDRIGNALQQIQGVGMVD